MTWAEWFGSNDRQIGDDDIGSARVSTVFLALDHNWRATGDPILFETMVFGGPLDGEQWRCATYSEAERQHCEAVAQVRKAAASIKAIADSAGAQS